MNTENKHSLPCEICNELSTRKLLHNTDPITGGRRGYICLDCANGLYYFRDNIRKLANAIYYILKYNNRK